METGTLGEGRRLIDEQDEPHEVRFDALYAEAKRALSVAANELRALRERAREIHAEAVDRWTTSDAAGQDEAGRLREAGAVGDSRSRSLPSVAGMTDDVSVRLAHERTELSRLDAAVRDLEEVWLFLERGETGDATASDDEVDDARVQMRLIEAREAERVRLAQELHDGPAQALTNALFRVDLLPRILERDPSAITSEVRAFKELLTRQLEQMRSYIHQLRPVLADAPGLDEALRERAEDLDGNVRVEVDLDAPELLLDDPQRVVVLRVAQEALQNVRKHAGAENVQLMSWLEPPERIGSGPSWVLEIRDDGRGFDVADPVADGNGQRHFGLRFMRERAELVGGRLDIESRTAQGTRVRLTIPVGERRN